MGNIIHDMIVYGGPPPPIQPDHDDPLSFPDVELTKGKFRDRFHLFSGVVGLQTLENYEIIPTPCLHRSFLFLNLKNVSITQRVCKLFHRVINSELFWREYVQNLCGSDPFYIELRRQNRHKRVNWKLQFYERLYLRQYRSRNKEFKRIMSRPYERNWCVNIPTLEVFMIGENKIAEKILSNKLRMLNYREDGSIINIPINFNKNIVWRDDVKYGHVLYKNVLCPYMIHDTEAFTTQNLDCCRGYFLTFTYNDGEGDLRSKFEKIREYHNDLMIFLRQRGKGATFHIIVCGVFFDDGRNQKSNEEEVEEGEKKVIQLLRELNIPFRDYCLIIVRPDDGDKKKKSFLRRYMYYPVGRMIEKWVDERPGKVEERKKRRDNFQKVMNRK